MEQESAEAAARAVLALWLSGGALVVALAAAGFTFWQAFIQHRAWSSSQRAAWTFKAVDPWSRASTSGWYLANTGGTAATNVSLTVLTVFKARPTLTYEAADQVPPGETVLLVGTEQRLPPAQLHTLMPDGKYRVVNRGDESEGALHLYDQWAVVRWTDANGKDDQKRIAIY